MTVQNLLDQIAAIKAAVLALPGATPPVDLQPVADALTDLAATVASKATPPA